MNEDSYIAFIDNNTNNNKENNDNNDDKLFLHNQKINIILVLQS